MDRILWRIAGQPIDLSVHGMIMGVLNVTPDSFSDGGEFFSAEVAIEHGVRMANDGARIIDVGGESTRPGAGPVAADEELRRVVPVISKLGKKTGSFISIEGLCTAWSYSSTMFTRSRNTALIASCHDHSDNG